MRTILLSLWCCAGCAGAQGDLPDGPGVLGDDTATADGGGDGGAGGPGGGGGDDAGGGASGGDLAGAGPVLWSGERRVTYVGLGGRQCTERVGESGEQLYGAGYARFEAACGPCQRAFEVDVDISRTRCISQGYAETVGRGLHVRSDGRVDVYRIVEDGAGYASELLAEGTFDGTTLTYAYTADDVLYREIRIEGTATFPVID